MAHAQTVASETGASRATIPARGWPEPARTRRSKALPAADHAFAIGIAPGDDPARDRRDLTSFVNRVLGWATPAAVASHSAGAA